jgi:hypothetical protein
MWNVRPVGGSSMLVVNLGWSPQRRQFGESGFGAALSMPLKIAPRPKRQVNFRLAKVVCFDQTRAAVF